MRTRAMDERRLRLGEVTVTARVGDGPGPTVVLVHGNSGSSRTFVRQTDGPLAHQVRLVTVDLPGHGDSPRAAAPERTYTLPGYADVLAGLAGALDLAGAVWAGWSMGGHVILEAATDLADPAGFLIFGTPPIGWPMAADAFLPNPAVGTMFREECTDEEVEALLGAWARPGRRFPAAFRDDFRRTDPRARSALFASLGPEGFKDEVAVVATLDRPLAVLHGAHDQLVSRAYLDGVDMPTLWRGQIQEISDAGHGPHWEAADQFNDLLAAFASEVA